MDNGTTDKRMMILALECSQPSASLCLANAEGGIICSASWHAERNHDAYLFPALQKAMDARGDTPLTHILVGAGPGSYGGVRVALAAAVGISAVTGAQVVSIGSWGALAAEAGVGACIISDARRGGWTLRHPDGRIEVVETAELLALQAGGARLFSIEPAELPAERGIRVESGGLIPHASGLVQSWLALPAEEQQQLAAQVPEPIYVRPPHITAAKRKPWETKA